MLPGDRRPQPALGGHTVWTEWHLGDCRWQAREPGLARCRDSFGGSASTVPVPTAIVELTTSQTQRPRRDLPRGPHNAITIRSVRETSRPQPRSPLERLAERLLLLPRAGWSGYLFGGAAIALTTAVLGPVMSLTRLANSSAVYTIPVL